ncbi:MAG: hypothetical protein C0404_13580 [Verrucomicrobia bacterium]|nr:hypothetical protein [Verrucomicrobiota bacterium]
MLRRRLDLWLREWEVDQALPADPDATEGARATAPAKPAGSRIELRATGSVPEPVSAGQIRLLHPLPDNRTDIRPFYVAVLHVDSSGGNVLVAPFSRFKNPAVPGELKSGLDGIHVRVICVWNARLLPGPFVARSWVAGELSGDRLRQAKSLYQRHVCERNILLGSSAAWPAGSLSFPTSVGPPSHDVASVGETGPPLQHPLDTRHIYLARESAAFDEIQRAAESNAGQRRSITYDCAGTGLLKAAEDRAEYGGKKPGRRRKK